MLKNATSDFFAEIFFRCETYHIHTQGKVQEGWRKFYGGYFWLSVTFIIFLKFKSASVKVSLNSLKLYSVLFCDNLSGLELLNSKVAFCSSHTVYIGLVFKNGFGSILWDEPNQCLIKINQ